MRNIKHILLLLFSALMTQGCGVYSFSGISISPEVKTFQVNFFQNRAPLIVPGVDRTFTVQLQDLILNQTNLSLTNTGGDIIYEGEITQYYVSPNTATSNNTAAQNRLSVTVKVRFYDTNDPDQDLDQSFQFFYDYPAATQENVIRDEALGVIFERITQDIFNATLARW